jgi:hypothetical protein
MKFFLSFVVVLAAILIYVRFVPSAPINPVLPVGGGHQEVNGHNAEVPSGEGNDSTRRAGENENGPEARVPAATPGQVYGTAFTLDPAGTVPAGALAAALGKRDSARVMLAGKATAVCQAKGCWMTLPTAGGQQVRVRFKDYAFFVPKDLSGHQVVVNGWAYRSTVPKADLQHYAKDAGKSDREVAAISRDEQQLTFMADGVMVQD